MLKFKPSEQAKLTTDDQLYYFVATQSHHEALVLTLNIDNCTTKHILIVNGISANILFLATIKVMGSAWLLPLFLICPLAYSFVGARAPKQSQCTRDPFVKKISFGSSNGRVHFSPICINVVQRVKEATVMRIRSLIHL